MIVKTRAMVLKRQNLLNEDQIITLLSEDHGIIRAIIRGKKGKTFIQASEVLSFCMFNLYKGKSNYIVNSCDTIEAFYSIRKDIEQLSLSLYFCELIILLAPTLHNAKEYLSVILNGLYLMCNKKRAAELIKSIIELKLMSLGGFMPNLIACNNCGIYDADKMHFNINEGYIRCDRCYCEESISYTGLFFYQLPINMLKSCRHIIYSENDKIFNFNLSGDSVKYLNMITEEYVKIKTEKVFNSLEMYKSLVKKLTKRGS